MPKHRRTDPTGRSTPEQFMQLPYSMVQSAAWRSLNGNSLKLLIELFSKFNGRNNGKLCVSYADASKKLGVGHATIKRCFDELQLKGFIRLKKRGHWYGRMAAEWAITTKMLEGYPATNDWASWRPAQTPKSEAAPMPDYTQH
jgi:hypothetical protein